MKRFPKLGLLAAAVALTCSQVLANPIEKIPADALMVVQFKELGATNTKVAKLARDFGINAFVPQAADPLGALKTRLNIKQGLDEKGSAAFVMLNPGAEGDPDDSVLMLLPVSDYKAFLSNFSGATTEGEITTVKLNQGGERDSYVADWGGYAAITPNAATLRTKPTAFLKVAGRPGQELKDKDVVLYANTPAIRSLVEPQIAEGKTKVLEELQKEVSQELPAELQPLLQAGVNQFFGVLESTLRDGESASISVNIVDTGIQASVVAQFAEGSYIGNSVKSLNSSGKPLTTGLPVGDYIAYGGATANPEAGLKVFNDITAPIVAAIPADAKYQPLRDYASAMTDLIGGVKAQSFAALVPEVNPGVKPLLQYVTVFQGDAAKIKSGQQKMLASQQSLVGVFAPEMGLTATSTVTPASKTVDGVAFDKIVVDLEGANADQQEQMMQLMYGPEGMQLYMGDLGNNTVLAYSGLEDAKVSEFIKSAKENSEALRKMPLLKLSNDVLPEKRFAEFYFQVDKFAGVALEGAAMFGFNANVTLPPDLAPFAFAGSNDGSAIVLDAYIPSNTVSALVSGGLQAFGQMQGGQRPGGRGGL